MKGIVLAGGTGSRLWPITKSVSKQLLPVYDKPMIYYPISTLMLAGIREILVITTPDDQLNFQNLLGDGSNFGVKFTYAVQPKPEGLAQALIIGEEFLEGDSCLLILGDNIFHGAGLGGELSRSLPKSGAHIFTYEVSNPGEYGVLEINKNNKPISITEKPKAFISNLAVTGLYFFDQSASSIAKTIKPSQRGELEITSLIEHYLNKQELTFTSLTRGTAWLDTGNPNSLNDAATYVRIIEERTGLKIACLEEIAFKKNWLNLEQLNSYAKAAGNNSYQQYLSRVVINES
jgi:glucose-1-phosphate thymidylyltransferase